MIIFSTFKSIVITHYYDCMEIISKTIQKLKQLTEKLPIENNE